MRRFIFRRLFFSLFTLFGATIIVFTLSRVAGDPRDLYAQEGGYGVSPETYAILEKQLGLDKPLAVQYFLWVGKVVRGDLGRSLLGQRKVTSMIGDKFGNTLKLTVTSWIVATIIGIPLGVLSAVKRGSPWDYVGRAFALFGQATPPFFIGILAILIFGVQLGWLPTHGHTSLRHFILPVGTLGLAASASYLRLTRSAMLEVLDSEYVKLARAKGVGWNSIIWKHALRNALLAPLTLSALIFVAFLTGTIIVETVFVWPGLGLLAVRAVSDNDFPVMTGVVLVFALMYTVIMFFSDLSYALIDPRIRLT